MVEVEVEVAAEVICVVVMVEVEEVLLEVLPIMPVLVKVVLDNDVTDEQVGVLLLVALEVEVVEVGVYEEMLPPL